MRRISVLTAIAIVTCLLNCKNVHGASFGDIFGGKKAQEFQMELEEQKTEYEAKLKEKDRKYQQLLEETRDFREAEQGMRDKNTTLMEAYEKIKKDYDVLVDQSKKLRREGQQCNEIRNTFDQMKQENEDFLKEKEGQEKKSEQLSATVENLKSHLKEVTAEKDQLAVFLAEAQEDEDVKIKRIREDVRDEMDELRKQVNTLKLENSRLVKNLEETEKQFRISQLDNTGLQQQMDILQAELDDFEKQYEEIKKENRYLAREATQFPKKFADLARHNRKLVKETADMHYNLGVSNIKSREYGRAVKEFEKVLELKPQDAYANYNLGYIYAEHLVDREKAIKYFENYLAYAPEAKDANWVRKYILTWQTWYGKNKLK